MTAYLLIAGCSALIFVAIQVERASAKEEEMTEPATTVAGGVAGYKLALLTMPMVAAIAGFWLGMRYVPLRSGHELQDVTNRMTACAASSFLLGIPSLMLLQQHMPGAFVAMQQLAVLAGLTEGIGVLVLFACVFLVCSIPGPWLLASVFLYLERRKGKDIGELVNEVRGQAAAESKGEKA
jgi:hypothetical protein